MAEQFRTYTKFQRHVNNANEIIDANDVNKIQKAVNAVESNIASVYDESFLQRVLFTFDNNLYANAMFVDEIKDAQYVDTAMSKDIVVSVENGTISVNPLKPTAEFVTVPITNENASPINDFILMVDDYIPPGSTIRYYLMTDAGDMHPIKANSTKTPFTVQSNYVTSIRIKAIMTKNVQGESPSISGLAVLYFDQIVENSYGMINPDLRRFYDIPKGNTVLVRDRAANDRLARVIEPNQITNLYYNEDGTLSYVESNDGSVRMRDSLMYGEYYNSKGVFERVLLNIENSITPIEEIVSESDIFEVSGDES